MDGLGNAMLGDFGLATVLKNEPSGLTTDADDGAVFKGSVRYSSPEVLDGEEKSIASDIWAWGCLLLEVRAANSFQKPEDRLMLSFALA